MIEYLVSIVPSFLRGIFPRPAQLWVLMVLSTEVLCGVKLVILVEWSNGQYITSESEAEYLWRIGFSLPSRDIPLSLFFYTYHAFVVYPEVYWLVHLFIYHDL